MVRIVEYWMCLRTVITARKRSLGKVIFHKRVSRSLFPGSGPGGEGIWSQGVLGGACSRGSTPGGCLLWGEVCLLGGRGGLVWSGPRRLSRPTPKGNVKGIRSRPHPRGKLRGIRARATPKGEIEGIRSRPPSRGKLRGIRSRPTPKVRSSPPDRYCYGWYASYWNAFLF